MLINVDFCYQTDRNEKMIVCQRAHRPVLQLQ